MNADILDSGFDGLKFTVETDLAPPLVAGGSAAIAIVDHAPVMLRCRPSQHLFDLRRPQTSARLGNIAVRGAVSPP